VTVLFLLRDVAFLINKGRSCCTVQGNPTGNTAIDSDSDDEVGRSSAVNITNNCGGRYFRLSDEVRII